MLTKSNYLSFIHCKKHFWLDEHKPGLAVPPDAGAQRRMMQGQQVDIEARRRFRNGRLIPYRPHPTEMVPLTQQAIEDGAEVLFQATFATEECLVKVDVLEKTAVGWHLIEVKSSTKVKEEHLPDIAFQYFVLRQAGLNVQQASIMHLNKACCYPNLTNLFTTSDVTAEVMSLQPQIAEDVVVMGQVVTENNEPEVMIGRFCKKPEPCSYHAHCWQAIDDWTIYDIPYLRREREENLEKQNILYIKDIEAEFDLKHKGANRFVQKQCNGPKVQINQKQIITELDKLTYPLYFFDFEAIDYALPLFDGCEPYHHVPFQYSCHILKQDGTITHREFLHTTPDDPRPSLIKALLTDLGENGTIIAYFCTYERRIFQKLAEQFPEHQVALHGFIDRLWDQYKLIKEHYDHRDFGGSKSLKSVLPVIVPELTYDKLVVQNGVQAQIEWENMVHGPMGQEKERRERELLAYCHLDTLAMVCIHQALT